MTKTKPGAKRVLVVGGGIAGTVMALACRKAGLEPVVAEAFDVNAEGVGAFLTVAPNGVRALQTLGLAEAALVSGFETPRFCLELGDGRVLRDLFLRVVLSRAAGRDPMAWIHDHDIAWDEPGAERSAA